MTDRRARRKATRTLHFVGIPIAPEKPCQVCLRRLDGILVLAHRCRPPAVGDLTACPWCHTPLTFGKEGFELAGQEHIDRLHPSDREMFMMMLQSRAMDAGMRPQ